MRGVLANDLHGVFGDADDRGNLATSNLGENAVLGAGDSVDYSIRPGRHAWVQVATGAIDVNGVALKEGDGLAVSDESALRLRGANGGESELLLFDLA